MNDITQDELIIIAKNLRYATHRGISQRMNGVGNPMPEDKIERISNIHDKVVGAMDNTTKVRYIRSVKGMPTT